MAAGNSWKWLVAVICSIFVVGLSFYAKRIIVYLRKLNNAILSRKKKLRVVFVLGSPGTGKTTLCAKLAKEFGYAHVSVSALLRAERDPDSQIGSMIQNIMAQGMLVPSEITVKVLQKAIQQSGNDTFLIDGFPRIEENRITFEKITKIEPEFVLFLECPEEETVKRLLNRSEGRDDDNIETIRKRFKIYKESTIPVVEYYDLQGKVRKVDAGKSIEEVYQDIKSIFSQLS